MLAAGSMVAVLLVLASAAAFGAMGVFGTLAYDEGANVGTLLSARFVIAALLWWALLLVTRPSLRVGRRDALLALALGALGYAGQAGGYFTALERMDASLLSLLVYCYPAIIAVAAVALGRERVEARRVAALLLTSGGLVLILAGAGTGAVDPLGTVLGIATALVYATYILSSEGVSTRVEPQVLATFVCTGAGAMLFGVTLASGQWQPAEVSAMGWLWMTCIAVISTVAAVALFFAGLRRVGPTTTAILSTAEPLVTVVLVMLVFGDVLGPLQILGGALMLAGVLALQVRVARRLEPAPA